MPIATLWGRYLLSPLYREENGSIERQSKFVQGHIPKKHYNWDSYSYNMGSLYMTLRAIFIPKHCKPHTLDAGL